MTDTYNTQESWHDDYFDAMEYFNELEEEELLDKLILQEDLNPQDKPIHRERRKNARKEKIHQLELAKSTKRHRHSPYRWNPLWHKMKLSDVSSKLFKNRSSDASTIAALKEFELADL